MNQKNKDKNKSHEAAELARQLAQKYGFGVGEINKVLTQCGIDQECIRHKFAELANTKKIEDAIKKFKPGIDGPSFS